MNNLKAIFPIVNTLPNHLRQYSQLTEEEIIESTKSFPYTIVVCLKIVPSIPFNGGSMKREFSFNELLTFARKKSQRHGQLFLEDSLNTSPWYRFHKIAGDALLRFLFEYCHLYRATTDDDRPYFLIQLTGSCYFPKAKKNLKRKNEDDSKKKEKKSKKKKTVEGDVEKSGSDSEGIDEEIITASTDDQEVGTKRKKHRRGKKKKKSKIDVPEHLSQAASFSLSFQAAKSNPAQITNYRYRQLAAEALKVTAKQFSTCSDLRERFINSNHAIALAAKEKKADLDMSLLQNTFGFKSNDQGFYEVRSSILILEPLLKRWIKLHRRRSVYSAYLDVYCPIDESIINDQNDQLPNLVKHFCSNNRVKSALESIFFKVISMDLFGQDNTARLLYAVIEFVISAGRYDVTSLHQFATCIKTSRCDWLSEIRDEALRQYLLLRLLNLVVKYLLNVVSSCFYVTESQSDKYRLFFYRKSIWLRITRLAESQFRTQCQLMPIKKNVPGTYYGPFALRWIPKSANDVRPIICNQFGQRRVNGRFDRAVMTMNNDLKPILSIAQWLVRRNPTSIGHATSGFNDIHTKWRNFVLNERKRQQPTKYYVVKADVTNCYNTINQKLLWRIVEEQLLANAPENFALQCHWVIRSLSASTDNSAASNFVSRKIRWSVRSEENYESLARYYTNLNGEQSAKNRRTRKTGSIVVPKGEPFLISKRDVARRLEQSIFRRLIAVNRKRYLQTLGIAQGSSLSVLLCNLYLAALEKKYLDSLIGEEDLFMRHIDDFLFVTTSLDRAQNFIDLLSNGFKDFNCYFKIEKTVTNFERHQSISMESEIFTRCTPPSDSDDDAGDWSGDDDDIEVAFDSSEIANIDQSKNHQVANLIPWCGFLFDAITLDVLVDRNRLRLKDMRDFIAVDFASYPPSYVVRKLFHYLRTRSSRIAFDRSINSPRCLRQNIESLVKFVSSCFGAYVGCYGKNSLINDGAKNRLKDSGFIEELVNRVYNVLSQLTKGAPKNVVRMKAIKKAFLKQVDG